jgi:CRP/FNR family transcriptional regulator
MKTSLVAVDFHGQGCSECAVRGFSVCASLDQFEMREFEQLSRRSHFASCETVFSQEDITSCFYNLLDGVMRLYKLLPDGRRQIVGFVLPGDFVGMTTEERHGFSADAIGPVTVCQFAKLPFGRFAHDKPNLLRRMNELAVQELNQARDLVSWRDRLVDLRGPSNIVPLPMSRQDIADYLGLTIETVSRTFTKLERDGIITILPGGVSLRDSARAEALAAA